MLILLASLGRIKYFHEENLFKRPRNPKMTEQMDKSKYTYLVFYTKNNCTECDHQYEKLRPIADQLLGIHQILLVNCDANNSVKFCSDKQVETPQLFIYQIKNDENASFDLNQNYTTNDLFKFVFMHRNPVYNVLNVTGLNNIVVHNDLGNHSLLVFSPKLTPHITLQKLIFTYQVKYQQKGIVVGNFDDDAFRELEIDLIKELKLEAGKHALVFFNNSKYYKFEGDLKNITEMEKFIDNVIDPFAEEKAIKIKQQFKESKKRHEEEQKLEYEKLLKEYKEKQEAEKQKKAENNETSNDTTQKDEKKAEDTSNK